MLPWKSHSTNNSVNRDAIPAATKPANTIDRDEKERTVINPSSHAVRKVSLDFNPTH
jgi:hypothetical protein